MQGIAQWNLKLRYFAFGDDTQVHFLFDAEERAENLHLVFHLDAGIHHVGLFRQFVDFQLEHFIFGNGTDVVASFGIPIQRIGRGIVGRRNIEVGLCCG